MFTDFFDSGDIIQSAGRWGTPQYLYSAGRIRHQFTRLTETFSGFPHRIFYAMKANPSPAVLGIIRGLGGGVDTVSPAELLLALKVGFDPKEILFTSNNMTDAEMELAGDTGVVFVIDSLSRLEAYGCRYPGRDVILRFNTLVTAGEDGKIQTATPDSKFGLLAGEQPEALSLCRRYGLRVKALHVHTGSGIKEAEFLLRSMEVLTELADPRDYPDLTAFDFGGGFTVPYRPAEKETDLDLIRDRSTDFHGRLTALWGRPLEFHFEPGKFLTADMGLYLIRVNTVKQRQGRLIAGTDGSFTHLIRPQLYGAYHPVLNLSNPDGVPCRTDVAGNICETGDLFCRDREIPEVRPGDLLAVTHAGGYVRAMASYYNLRPLPTEVLADKEASPVLRLIRQALSPGELARRIWEGEL
jgi:diaminopimelate decarboxylase